MLVIYVPHHHSHLLQNVVFHIHSNFPIHFIFLLFSSLISRLYLDFPIFHRFFARFCVGGENQMYGPVLVFFSEAFYIGSAF